MSAHKLILVTKTDLERFLQEYPGDLEIEQKGQIARYWDPAFGGANNRTVIAIADEAAGVYKLLPWF